MPIQLYTHKLTLDTDTLTPIQLYLKVRDHYPHSVLFENLDAQEKHHFRSYLAFDPFIRIAIHQTHLLVELNDTPIFKINYDSPDAFLTCTDQLLNLFQAAEKNNVRFWGYNQFEAISLFENIATHSLNEEALMLFVGYKNTVEFNHATQEITLTQINTKPIAKSCTAQIKQFIASPYHAGKYEFETTGEKKCSISNEDFLNIVHKAQNACRQGNLFQVVLSRCFQQAYLGDEFEVYRALRKVSPAPFMYYADYGNRKILGASPEALISVKNNTLYSYPIAGTYRRTQDENLDHALGELLKADPKERAEHAMLVDLSRNDISKIAQKVSVPVYAQAKQFSHVIHLVSEVKGEKLSTHNPFRYMQALFPAGTLSGAPKFHALECIRDWEGVPRGFYGGSIGYFDLQGNSKMAILIRSIICKNQQLYYQSGAGIVLHSEPEKELEEVNNKLQAIEIAIKKAQLNHENISY